MNMSKNAAYFQMFGGFSLVGAIVIALFVYSTWNLKQHGGPETSGVFMLSYIAVPVGTGLLFLRKWAALLLSIPLLLLGAWWIVGSVISGSVLAMLLNFFFGGLLIAPSVVTYKHWSELSWRGKWFI